MKNSNKHDINSSHNTPGARFFSEMQQSGSKEKNRDKYFLTFLDTVLRYLKCSIIFRKAGHLKEAKNDRETRLSGYQSCFYSIL